VSVPDFSLAGKVAIVTGGRRGIGKTIALAFAEAGADVVVCDWVVDDGTLEAVAEEIRGLGRRSLAIRADTSRKADVENMVQEVMAEFGTIDVLLNNASISPAGLILDMAEEEWDRCMTIDLKGYFLCSQAVGKRMVEQKKGNILCIASQFAFQPIPTKGAYSIAKAGVVMLVRMLARELGSCGIRANAIAPGLVKTELTRGAWTNPEVVKFHAGETSLGRISETEDLVGAALFLASDASAYVTGHTILVDGGRMA